MLHDISAGNEVADALARLSDAWQDGKWLDVPMQRRTSTDTASPDVVVARARMIEDASQRATPTAATIQVHVAVTNSVYFSTARISGTMSTLLMTVVLGFFFFQQVLSIRGQQVSAEVLAIVLTLFSAIQAGRIERADRSTMRGMLSPAGNPLILASIVPTVVLAVALAFSLSVIWAMAWAGVCIAGQLLLLFWQWLLLRRALAQGLRHSDRVQAQSGLTLYTEAIDYSHTEVLHSHWWRTTTADALMVGRQAYGYVIWQHGTPHAPPTLRSLLRSGRPAGKSASSPRIQAPWLSDWRRGSRSPGQQATAGTSGGNWSAAASPTVSQMTAQAPL